MRYSVVIFLSLVALHLSALDYAPAGWSPIPPVTGTTFYVDGSNAAANDTNPGTEALPWRTITKAASTVSAGQRVIVKAGNYVENLSFTRGGSATAGVSFENVPRRSATVRNVALRAQYLRFKGFKVTGSSGVDIDTNNSEVLDCDIRNADVAVDASGSNLRVADNYAYQCQYGVIAYGQNIVVERNEVERLSYSGSGDADYSRFFGDYIVYRNNYFHGTIPSEIGDAHVDGFQTFDNNGEHARNILFEGNTIMHCHQGLMAESLFHDASSDFIFRNNIFSQCWAWGLCVEDVDRITVINNTFVQIQWHAVGFGANSVGNIVKNNIFYNGGSNYWAETGSSIIDGGNNLLFKAGGTVDPTPYSTDRRNVDPRFASTAGFDYHLQAGSPAIDAGTSAGVLIDRDGVARPQGAGVDIGAYEAITSKSFYVRAGAAGVGTGADWANAWNSFDRINWAAVSPGDSIYIAGGTYGPLAILKSGTAGNPITIRRATVSEHGAASGWNNAYDARVIIDGGDALAAIGFGEGGDWAGKSHVTVDGATRYGIWAKNAGFGVRACRGPTNDNLTLRNLELGDTGAGKLGEDGIQGKGSNLLVEACYIHDNDDIGTHGDAMQWFAGNNVVFRYNVVKNSGQIFMLTEIWGGTSYDYVDNLTICYNIFYNRGGTHYDGIKWKLAPRAGFTWKIHNNTFDLEAPTGTGDWEDRVMAGPSSSNIDVRNNAVLNSRRGGMGDGTCRNNGYDNGGTYRVPDLPATLSETGAVLAADLGCVNPAAADYHLLSTSPLIGKGVNVGLTRDFDGNPVGATPCIGAFEFVSTTITAPAIITHPQNASVTAGQTATFSAAASGTAPLTFQWQRRAPGGTTWSNVGTNSASYTTPTTTAAESGSAFRVIVSNSAGSATSNAATLTVAAQNRAPVAANLNVTTTKNTAVALKLSASDLDGDALTYAIVSNPQHGTLSGTAPNLTYTPARKYSGADSFTFRASDGKATSNTATVSITVTRRAPVMASALAAVPNPATKGQSVSFPIAVEDPDGDTLAWNWNFGDGAQGEGSTGTHVFSTSGAYTVNVTVTDEDGLVITSTVQVSVLNENDGGGGGGGLGGGGTPVVKTPMSVSKLSGKVNFASSGRDACNLVGTIPDLPSKFDPTGANVTVNVGGAVVRFTLDSKGKAITGDGSIRMTLKPSVRNKETGKVEFLGGPVAFKLQFRNGTWTDDWADEGVDPTADATGKSITITADVTLNGKTYTSTLTKSYSAKAGRSGAFK